MARGYSSSGTIFERIRRSKLVLVPFLAILILIAGVVIREKKGQIKTGSNISALEQEVASLKSNNSELSGLIEYLKSDEFVDREAREKLNMQKPGEKVVLVAKQEIQQGQVEGASVEKEKANYELWVEYFLGN